MPDTIYTNAYPSDDLLPDMEVSNRLNAYICTACGAELLTKPGEELESCPFCGSRSFLPGRNSASLPDAYILFNIDSAEAARRCEEYCSSRMMLPASFVRHLSSIPLRKIFIPFWLYSGCASVDMSFRTIGQDKQPKIVSCSGKLEYQKLPLPASAKLSDGFLEMLLPYDFSKLQPFFVLRTKTMQSVEYFSRTCMLLRIWTISVTSVATLMKHMSPYRSVRICWLAT